MLGKRFLVVLLTLGYLGTLGVVGVAYYSGLKQAAAWPPKVEGAPVSDKDVPRVRKNVQALEKKIAALQPRGVYIVVDTGENRLYVKKGDEVVRQAVVSCGSGDVLQDPSGKRKWVFDTPRGEFYVKSKITNPYWVKPDWAFIEEGEPIPRRQEDRVEAGSLGDYALGFGDGFFIHGTLYTRLLGRNVTHGCVRMGDDDLKEIFKIVPLGTKIYIY
jgi:lipoprotein-anchoring transpeptidase ErfK/SrfK